MDWRRTAMMKLKKAFAMILMMVMVSSFVAAVQAEETAGMLLAEATVGKPWTARVGAGSLGSAGHCGHLRGHRKGRRQIYLRRPVCSLLHLDHIKNSRGNQEKHSELL